MNAADRALLVRAYTLLLWCATHWHTHIYEGSPSVHFLSRIDRLLEELRARLGEVIQDAQAPTL